MSQIPTHETVSAGISKREKEEHVKSSWELLGRDDDEKKNCNLVHL